MVRAMKSKKELFFSLIVLLIVFFDQLIKYFILKINPNLNLKILEITLIKNTGAGFGILQNQTLLLGIISLLVALLIIIYYKTIPKDTFPQILFALFLGGVIGNMIDRLFRGYVIDFINFGFWPAFNLADSVLTVSAIGLIIYYWRKD